jgi:hypothetical protein
VVVVSANVNTTHPSDFRHTTMACFALITLAVYIIQHTLLPAATFKETMRDDDLGQANCY